MCAYVCVCVCVCVGVCAARHGHHTHTHTHIHTHMHPCTFMDIRTYIKFMPRKLYVCKTKLVPLCKYPSNKLHDVTLWSSMEDSPYNQLILRLEIINNTHYTFVWMLAMYSNYIRSVIRIDFLRQRYKDTIGAITLSNIVHT